MMSPAVRDTIDSIQYGGLWIFRNLASQNPSFQEQLSFCTFVHPHIGIILLAFAKFEDSTLAVFALSKLGPDTYIIPYSFPSKLDEFLEVLGLHLDFQDWYREATLCAYEFLCTDSVSIYIEENWLEASIDPEYAEYIFSTIDVFQSDALVHELLSIGPTTGFYEFTVDVLMEGITNDCWWADPSTKPWRSFLGNHYVSEKDHRKVNSPTPSIASGSAAGNMSSVWKKKNLLFELMRTESTYVTRLRHLLNDYVLPLRTSAKSSKKLIGLYEINTLFPPNLAKLIQINSTFLDEIEAIMAELDEDTDSADDITDDFDLRMATCLWNHFQVFAQHYPRYLEQSNDFGEVLNTASKNPKFLDFIDRIKIKENRNVSLSQLIMEPVQRIPRYFLFLEQIITLTLDGPPQQTYVRAMETVHNIAEMPVVDAEERSKIFAGLQYIIPNLAPNLISNSRDLLDCIDVNREIWKSGQLSLVPYTILLFTDCICLLKRHSKASLADVIVELKQTFVLPKSFSREKSAQYVAWNFNDNIELTRGIDEDCTIWLISKSASTFPFFREFPLIKFVLTNGKHSLEIFLRSFQQALAFRKSQEMRVTSRCFNDFTIFYSCFTPASYEKEKYRTSIICVCNDEQNSCNAEHLLCEGNVVLNIHRQNEGFIVEALTWLSFDLPSKLFVSEESIEENISEYLISIKRMLSSPFSNRCFSQYDLYENILQYLLLSKRSPKKGRLSLGGRPSSPIKWASALKGTYGTKGYSKSCSTLPSQKHGNTDTNFNPRKSLSNYTVRFPTNGSFKTILETLKSFKSIFLGMTDYGTILKGISPFEGQQLDILLEDILKESPEFKRIQKLPEAQIYLLFWKYLKLFVVRKYGSLLPSMFIQRLSNNGYIGFSYDLKVSLQQIQSCLQELPQQNLRILDVVLNIVSELLLRLPLRDQCETLIEQMASVLSPPLYRNSAIEVIRFMTYYYDQLFKKDTLDPENSPLSKDAELYRQKEYEERASQQVDECLRPKEIVPGKVELKDYEYLRQNYHMTLAKIAQMTKQINGSKEAMPILYDQLTHDLKLIKQSIQANLARKRCELDIAKWTLKEYEDAKQNMSNNDYKMEFFL
ncbi:RhoGEF Gef2 [Schizosaccharomyces cryophilus OY26]|uniref:RhoGEF Gef2 n=1 Tax=Schizosaccharomyces cryophilus (strain OY26 / ATCC MYA-4695 / CBS 11777 / NBRC 106824 / NRRL Y48691) TaxID=653667 RepID=S9X7C9_SCHCR|nr:RhoGEF Gef2 [Schizosaccharomyces cryophilus OY26]EPY49681.1 RhoGEF Gef2 [Schizosaccharomyces cryophilus OY26]